MAGIRGKGQWREELHREEHRLQQTGLWLSAALGVRENLGGGGTRSPGSSHRLGAVLLPISRNENVQCNTWNIG